MHAKGGPRTVVTVPESCNQHIVSTVLIELSRSTECTYQYWLAGRLIGAATERFVLSHNACWLINSRRAARKPGLHVTKFSLVIAKKENG